MTAHPLIPHPRRLHPNISLLTPLSQLGHTQQAVTELERAVQGEYVDLNGYLQRLDAELMLDSIRKWVAWGPPWPWASTRLPQDALWCGGYAHCGCVALLWGDGAGTRAAHRRAHTSVPQAPSPQSCLPQAAGHPPALLPPAPPVPGDARNATNRLSTSQPQNSGAPHPHTPARTGRTAAAPSCSRPPP